MVRHRIEAALFRAGLLLIPLLPRAFVLWLSRGFGWVAFHAAGRLRRMCLTNLELALGDSLSGEERRRVALRSLQSFVLVALDLFWFNGFTRRRLKRYVKTSPSYERMLTRSPLVAVTGHLGNWELLGQSGAIRKPGLVSIAAPLENPLIDRALTASRGRTGQVIAMQTGAVRTSLRALREGGTVGLLLDQNIVPRDGGVFVDFFGLPVPMSKAAAGLAMKTGATVATAFCFINGDGTYTCEATELLTLSPGEDEVVATQRIARAMEAAVRQRPEQWLWSYRRWKYIPDGRTRQGYPRYARPLRPEERVRKPQ